MPHKPTHYFGNLVALILLAGLVYGAIKYKGSPLEGEVKVRFSGMTQGIQEFINVRKHNISMELDPPRKRPYSFLEREGKLELWAPDIFGEFSEQEWSFFWHLIYDQTDQRQNGHTVKRYYTRREVQNILRDNFSGLSYLKDPEWSELWSVAGVAW